MTEELISKLYDDVKLQQIAWEHAQTWTPEILNGLTGEDVDGNTCSRQNIKCMLDQVEDLGEFTTEEWEKFFEKLRVEGI